MGRTLKRVPLDFAWPQGKIWEGYLNPISPEKCKECNGSGDSHSVRRLKDKWYGFGEYEIKADWVWLSPGRRYNRAAWQYNLDKDDVQALLDANRLWNFTKVPRTREQAEIVEQRLKEGHNSWLPENNGYIPTPEEVNAWSIQSFGHDGINCFYVIEAKAKKLGLSLVCPCCDGEGCIWSSSEQKQEHENWEPSEPPTGEGYQLWETTTEGSPDSPVFSSLDALCQWCEKNATTFADYTASAQEWKKMLSEDFVIHQEGNSIFL